MASNRLVVVMIDGIKMVYALVRVVDEGNVLVNGVRLINGVK